MLNEEQFPTMKPIDMPKKRERKEINLAKVKVEPLFEDMVDFEKFSECDFRAVKIKSCTAVPKSKI